MDQSEIDALLAGGTKSPIKSEGSAPAKDPVLAPPAVAVPAHTEPHADGSGHVRRALEACVHVGHDTDTTAAIAGGLLGARYGLAGMPDEWWRMVKGWPGLADRRQYRAEDLARLSLRTALGGSAGPDDEEILRRVARDERAAGEVDW